jgi:hypothetical protein
LALSKDDKRYWAPITTIIAWLIGSVIGPNDRVLDIGPGHCPFPRADVGVDFLGEDKLNAIWDQLKVKHRTPEIVQSDFALNPLPFADKEFDFIYCRHTLEDLANPDLLLREMSRVGMAGYIETPSPMAELTHGVDGYADSHVYRGYLHHRWCIWVEDGRLHLVSKYPLIEHMLFDGDKVLEGALREGPALWNTYCLWEGGIAWKRHENSIDFDCSKNYGDVLARAVVQSARSTNAFVQMLTKQRREVA